MNGIGRVLWIVAKGIFLLVGLGAVLGGGICGAMLVAPAMGNDHLARDFLWVAGGVVIVGLVIAIPAWKSLRRDHAASKARLEAELETIRKGGGSQP